MRDILFMMPQGVKQNKARVILSQFFRSLSLLEGQYSWKVADIPATVEKNNLTLPYVKAKAELYTNTRKILEGSHSSGSRWNKNDNTTI